MGYAFCENPCLIGIRNSQAFPALKLYVKDLQVVVVVVVVVVVFIYQFSSIMYKLQNVSKILII